MRTIILTAAAFLLSLGTASAASVDWDISDATYASAQNGKCYSIGDTIDGDSYRLTLTLVLQSGVDLNEVNILALGDKTNFPAAWGGEGGSYGNRDSVLSFRFTTSEGSTTLTVGNGNYTALSSPLGPVTAGDTITIGLAYDSASAQFTLTLGEQSATFAAPEGIDLSPDALFVHNDVVSITGGIEVIPQAVPEPAALAFLALGAAALALRRRA